MDKTLILNWKHHWVEDWELYLPLLRDFPWIHISPPIPMLGLLAIKANPQQIIAPYMSCDPLGPFTGACGPDYLKSLEVSTVLLGHSEQKSQDAYEPIAKKIRYAQDSGLTVVLCVGESVIEKYREQLFVQIQPILSRPNSKIAIAYEPKWAIGTGKSCSPEHCLEALSFLQSHLPRGAQIDFYYGGSINCQNAQSFLRLKELKGLLVGSLSIKSENVKKLIEIMNTFKGEVAGKKVISF